MLDLQVDILVMHSLDTCLGNETERVQALRFIRRVSLCAQPQYFNIGVCVVGRGNFELLL